MTNQILTEIEREARIVCEEKGYDPDFPTGETRKQWESFTEIARVRLANRAATTISEAMGKSA